MQILKKSYLLALILSTGISSRLLAQGTGSGSGEDFMNSNGKIYVVVAVVVLIVIALFAYLFYLDRKIARMEKEHDQQ